MTEATHYKPKGKISGEIKTKKQIWQEHECNEDCNPNGGWHGRYYDKLEWEKMKKLRKVFKGSIKR